MLSQHHVPIMQEFHAYYYEYNEYTEEYADPRLFTYNTYDDSQYRQWKAQQQSGVKTTAHSLSIETVDDLPFKAGDRISIPRYDNDVFNVSEKEFVEDNYASLVNLMFPSDTSTAIKRLHLNKSRS